MQKTCRIFLLGSTKNFPPPLIISKSLSTSKARYTRLFESGRCDRNALHIFSLLVLLGSSSSFEDLFLLFIPLYFLFLYKSYRSNIYKICKAESTRLLKRLFMQRIIIHMLCRSCGQELDSIRMCAMCKEAVQWKCFSCNKEGDTSIHVHAGTISASLPIGRISEA
jgi:hypothetical protein